MDPGLKDATGVNGDAGGGTRAVAAVRGLHEAVDRAAAALAKVHAGRIRCGLGCAGCCIDGLTVLPIEAARIEAEHGELLDRADPAPEGRCAFLDPKGACRIYPSRPYRCRTHGLPFVHFEETADGDLVEHRDVCELNADGPPLAGLPIDALWPLGPFELELLALEERHLGMGLPRVPLRSLFRGGARRPPPVP